MIGKIVQTAYTFDSVEGTRIVVANDENGVIVSVGADGEETEFTIGADEAVALPKLLSKLNRESGRVTVNPRGPRTKNS